MTFARPVQDRIPHLDDIRATISRQLGVVIVLLVEMLLEQLAVTDVVRERRAREHDSLKVVRPHENRVQETPACGLVVDRVALDEAKNVTASILFSKLLVVCQ